MITIRAVGLIDGDGEDLAASELVKDARAARPFEQSVAQLPLRRPRTQVSTRNRRQVVGQLEDIAGEILAHEPAARPDARQQAPPVLGRLPARREVEQLQARGPALRATGEDGQLSGRDRLAIELAEQLFDLPGAEAQVVAADAPAARPRPAAATG